MGHLITSADTRTIHAAWWQEGETVTIRRWTTVQEDRLYEEILRIAGRVGDVTEVQLKAAKVPVMDIGIKEWTLLGDDGKVLPLNRKTVEALCSEDSTFISNAIWDYNRGRNPEEEATFPAGA